MKRRVDGTVIDLGLVGEVTEVNIQLLDLLEADYVPVVASVGTGEAGESYNINADTVAGALAAALKAEKVIFLTDVSGLHSDLEDDSTLISQCTAHDVVDLMESGKVSKGMIPKLEAVLTSLRAGVGRRSYHRRPHRPLGAARGHDRRRRAGHQDRLRRRPELGLG